MNREELVKVLEDLRKQYLQESSDQSDYWYGKASGLLLAIEIIEGRWNS